MSRLPDYLCVTNHHKDNEPQKYYLVSDVGEPDPEGYVSFSSSTVEGVKGTTIETDNSAVLYETVTESGFFGPMKAPAFENELVRLIHDGEITMFPCATCKHKLPCLVDRTHVVTYEKKVS